MNPGPHQALLDLYQEWRRLTELEGAAIARDEWPAVEEHQRLKRDLRDQIILATQQWHAEGAAAGSGPDSVRASFERYFRPIVADLIALEHRNQQVLGEHRSQMQSRLASASQSTKRLRNLQRSYAPERSPRWQSYS